MSISGISNKSNTSVITAGSQSSSTAGNGFAALLTKLQSGLSVTTGSSNNNNSSNNSTISATNGASLTAQQTAIPYAPPTSSATTSSDPVIQKFLNYMNETPAEKFEDQWLVAHHLTREDLKNMSPEKRAAIMKQMEADMKLEIEQQTQKKTGAVTDSGELEAPQAS